MGADVAEMAASIWRDVLQVSEVATTDNFFALGGHSMLATRAMSRLRKALGSPLPVHLIFEHPEFGAFVAGVEGSLDTGGTQDQPLASGRQTGLVSAQQEELLRIELALGPSPLHNVVLAAHSKERIDADRLRKAAQSVLNRHAALRIRFPSADRQTVGPVLALSEVDLEVVTGLDDERSIRKAVRRAHLRPFTLDGGNLLRVQLFERAEDDLLVLHLHHLAVDGRSQAVILDDLFDAYAAERDGRPPSYAGAGPSYLDYAHWQRSGLDALIAESRTHWRAVVAELAPEHRGGAPRGQELRCARMTREVPAAVADRLRSWVRREGATEFLALAAATAAAVARLTGRARVGVGTLLDNRGIDALERTVGLFATSTLLSVDVEHVEDARELTRRVRSSLTEARKWENVPLPLLLDRPSAEQGVEPGELIDVVVALNDTTPVRSAPYEPVVDAGAPLADTAVIAGPGPWEVTFLSSPQGLRVQVEVTDTAAAPAEELATEVVAVLAEFADDTYGHRARQTVPCEGPR